MKRLAIFLDAIGNIVGRRPSNVLKAARATQGSDETGIHQITSYDSGVGLMNRAPDWGAKLLRLLDKVLGGAWGSGFENSVERAYNFLCANYCPGDEIFLFGYSRGAGQARSLCQLIDWAGGLPPSSEAHFLPGVVARHLQGQRTHRSVVDEINRKRNERGCDSAVAMQPVQIRFLGLWDTLLPLRPRRWSRRAGQFSPELPPNVDTVRHALAIDDRRHDFRAELLQTESPDACESLEQRWFPGGHADVGGGRRDDGLANVALRWICDEASRAGLAFNPELIDEHLPNPFGRCQKKLFNYQVMDTLLWPFRGFKGERTVGGPCCTVDTSAIERLNADPAECLWMDAPYRPANLLRYLAEHPEFDDDVSAEVLNEVERRRAQ